MTVDLSPPSDPNNHGAQTTYGRLVAAYRCCLHRAGFPKPTGVDKLHFQGNREINEEVEADPKAGISFDEAVKWFEKCWELDHDSIRGKEDLRAMLVFLTQRRKPGGDRSVSGYVKIRESDLRGSHTPDGETQSFPKQIKGYLREGKIVIVDLSEGSPTIQKNFSEKICRRVFESSISNFTERRNNNFIQFYFEEAHNLFPQAESKDFEPDLQPTGQGGGQAQYRPDLRHPGSQLAEQEHPEEYPELVYRSPQQQGRDQGAAEVLRFRRLHRLPDPLQRQQRQGFRSNENLYQSVRCPSPD